MKNLGPQYDHGASSIKRAKNNIRISDSTYRATYLTINPELTLNDVFKGYISVLEFSRIAFSRIRTSSHSLRIETGRWSRLPRKLRTCQCRDIQTKEHVLLICSMSEMLRFNLPLTVRYRSASHLLNTGYPDIINICYFCTKVLDRYSWLFIILNVLCIFFLLLKNTIIIHLI